MRRATAARRSACLAFVAVLVTLALPVLHPGAWAHGIIDGGEPASAAPLSGDGSFVDQAHQRCPLCHALAQGRSLLAAPATPGPAAPAAPSSHLEARPSPGVPGIPRLAGPGPRAPPSPA